MHVCFSTVGMAFAYRRVSVVISCSDALISVGYALCRAGWLSLAARLAVGLLVSWRFYFRQYLRSYGRCDWGLVGIPQGIRGQHFLEIATCCQDFRLGIPHGMARP